MIDPSEYLVKEVARMVAVDILYEAVKKRQDLQIRIVANNFEVTDFPAQLVLDILVLSPLKEDQYTMVEEMALIGHMVLKLKEEIDGKL